MYPPVISAGVEHSHSSKVPACQSCFHSKIDRDGWCYMFAAAPRGHCMKFTRITP